MRKLLLSFAVIGTFFIYGLRQREEDAARLQAITPPKSLLITPTTVPTATIISPTQAPHTIGPTTAPTAVSVIPTNTPIPQGQYKNGTYTGSGADAFYGTIQVQAVIQNGRIADVIFLQYPSDRSTSVMINQQAMPYLRQEAIAVQNANVDIVSGATDSSMAFRESLGSALAQAH